MRKAFLIFLVLMILQSCWNESNKNIKVIKLKNNKSLILNNINTLEFDTLYQWEHFSDNYCDDSRKSRLSSKDRPIEMESGFFYDLNVLDKRQVTIIEWNEGCKQFGDWLSLEEELEKYIKELREGLEEAYLEGAIKITLQLIENINGQVYGVLGVHLRKSDEFLKVVTILEGNLIAIEYECCCQECEGFAKKMFKEHLALIKVK